MSLQKVKRVKNKKLTDSYEHKPCLVCGLRLSCAAHIKSKGSGGHDIPENLLVLCKLCHTEQHTLGIITFAEKYKSVMIFYINNGFEIIEQGGRKRLIRSIL